MPIRILVVDDEPDVEALMRQKFRRQIREGVYEFHFAGDGEDALEKIRQVPDVDILITDINMPRMDGLTLLEKVRERQLRLNAVVVSAYGDLANIRTAMNRGAFDFLMKPIDFVDFEITLAKTWEQISRTKQADRDQAKLLDITQELKVASIIQRAILPTKFPAFPGRTEFEVHARNYPVKEVSGDFYDYFLIGENKLALLICDVSGKGIPSALYMAVCRTVVRACAEPGKSAAQTLEEANRRLCEEDYASMFATMLYAIFDTESGSIEICTAGHELPYLLRHGSAPALIEMPRNLALGVEAEVEFKSIRHRLEPGDALFLYTDGATEAQNGAGELYRVDRLEACLTGYNPAEDGEQLLDDVHRSVETFAAGAPQFDDITLMVLRYLR
jgi:sigma-B regulation protein RsbU (phosphoserine phosphatase)